MNRGLRRQVNPKVVAVVILLTLAIVQWAWWRGLVVREQGGGRGGGGGGGAPGSIPLVVGRESVQVDTLAGDTEPGLADGPGYRARFDGPTGLAIDRQGRLYVADTRNHRIRQIAPNGKTTTLAGGEAGFADGPAPQAQFNSPCGVAVAPDGAVYVADTGNHRIRRIQDGQVTTLAGGAPGMADGQGAAARFNLPCGLAYVVANPPYLLVADAGNRRVRRVELTGRVVGGSAVPGAPTVVVADAARTAVAVPQAGALLIGAQALRNVPIDTAGQDGRIRPGQLALRQPVALWPVAGDWLAVDAGHSAVFLVRDGKAEVLAGICSPVGPRYGWRDNTGDRAGFGILSGIVADGAGRIYVSDTTNNSIRRLTAPFLSAAP